MNRPGGRREGVDNIKTKTEKKVWASDRQIEESIATARNKGGHSQKDNINLVRSSS